MAPRFSTRISYWLVWRIMIAPGPTVVTRIPGNSDVDADGLGRLPIVSSRIWLRPSEVDDEKLSPGS